MSIEGKAAAGRKAAELIEDGMLVGLGTGSTAHFFIKELGRRCREEGLRVRGVATSSASEALASREDIPLISLETVFTLDLAVDGADEIDPSKRMIKGGGGALFREKIAASMSREMIVIIDESKKVNHLGKFPLPVEVVPLASLFVLNQLKKLGYSGKKRDILSDNGNFLVDIPLGFPCDHPEKIHHQIKNIPGVIETGFFFSLAGRVITGFKDGHVTID